MMEELKSEVDTGQESGAAPEQKSNTPRGGVDILHTSGDRLDVIIKKAAAKAEDEGAALLIRKFGSHYQACIRQEGAAVIEWDCIPGYRTFREALLLGVLNPPDELATVVVDPRSVPWKR